jgi:hypothetical protein
VNPGGSIRGWFFLSILGKVLDSCQFVQEVFGPWNGSVRPLQSLLSLSETKTPNLLTELLRSNGCSDMAV